MKAIQIRRYWYGQISDPVQVDTASDVSTSGRS